jgi:hypothetical protein
VAAGLGAMVLGAAALHLLEQTRPVVARIAWIGTTGQNTAGYVENLSDAPLINVRLEALTTDGRWRARRAAVGVLGWVSVRVPGDRISVNQRRLFSFDQPRHTLLKVRLLVNGRAVRVTQTGPGPAAWPMWR